VDELISCNDCCTIYQSINKIAPTLVTENLVGKLGDLTINFAGGRIPYYVDVKMKVGSTMINITSKDDLNNERNIQIRFESKY